MARRARQRKEDVQILEDIGVDERHERAVRDDLGGIAIERHRQGNNRFALDDGFIQHSENTR